MHFVDEEEASQVPPLGFRGTCTGGGAATKLKMVYNVSPSPCPFWGTVIRSEL